MEAMEQRFGLCRSRVRAVVKALCGLALRLLLRGERTFCEERLSSCGLEVKEAVLYSGLCCQLFTEELCGGHWSFSFLHPCLQDFLSALCMSYRGDQEELHGAVRHRPLVLHFLQELHVTEKDNPMVQHLLQELDTSSSVSELSLKTKQRSCSSEKLTDSRRSAQMFSAAPLSGQEDPPLSASEDPTESTARSQQHSRNPATERSSGASSCRSQARANGEGQTKNNFWKTFCSSVKGTVLKLSQVGQT